MSGARLGSLWAIAGLGLSANLPGCGGDAFTSAAPDGATMGATMGPDANIPDAAGLADAAALDAGAGWCATQAATHTFCEDFLHGVPGKLVGISSPCRSPDLLFLPSEENYGTIWSEQPVVVDMA